MWTPPSNYQGWLFQLHPGLTGTYSNKAYSYTIFTDQQAFSVSLFKLKEGISWQMLLSPWSDLECSSLIKGIKVTVY